MDLEDCSTSGAEETPLVHDAELGSEVSTEPRQSSRRYHVIGGGVVGLLVLACFAAFHNSSGTSVNAKGVVGFSNFGDISVGDSSNTQIGDGNTQSNVGTQINTQGGSYVGGDNTGQMVGTNNGNLIGGDNNGVQMKGDNKGNLAGVNNGVMKNVVEAKKCEGSGNGDGHGAAQVVCCYSPKGPGCCQGATFANGGGGGMDEKKVKDLRKWEKKADQTKDKDMKALVEDKVKKLKKELGIKDLDKGSFPDWSSKLPVAKTSGVCPHGTTKAK